MPAIQLARLKIQVDHLVETARQPGVFVRGLHDLFSLYADRVYRPGQSGEPHPLLTAYHVPLPVQRQIAQAMEKFTAADPAGAVAVCDALWAEPYLEFRLLAAFLLGRLPLESSHFVLDRAQQWLAARPEDRLVDALLSQGFARLRQEAPEQYLKLAGTWLNAPEDFIQQMGLRALLPLLDDPTQHHHLPALFRLITPFTRIAPKALRNDVLAILRRLARFSPQETAYFLRQCLSSPDNPDTIWLARQVLPDLPEEISASLRAALKAPRQAANS